MGDNSHIEWTDATWNPVTGCTKVSQGCKNCYAERDWARLSAPRPKPNIYTGRAFTDVQCHPDRLDQPMRWKKPRMVFVNSMSDLFHEDIPDEFIDRVFAVMALCPQHTFQVLTKRPERMCGYMNSYDLTDRIISAAHIWDSYQGAIMNADHHIAGNSCLPLPNVWLGVSVEDQTTANERVPLLLQTPAAVRWVSAEPLLGPVDLNSMSRTPGAGIDEVTDDDDMYGPLLDGDNGIDWVVVGGESGPNARPMHPDWVRSIRDQCQAAGVPFFFKQWGEWAPSESFGETQYITADVYCFPLDVQPLSELEAGCVVRIGKKAAGRTLDGRTWEETPTNGGECDGGLQLPSAFR